MKKHQPIQISIPQPCSEDWNKMTPQEQGRFCAACQKCVVDFTGFNDQQLYNYLRAHKDEKVCGRFRNTQLNRTIHIPPQPHSRLYRIAIAVGLTLAIVSTAEVHSFAKAPLIEYNFLERPQEDSTINNSDSTVIKGKVVDEHGEPAINAAVQLIKDEIVIDGMVTDYDGNYQIKVTSQKGNGELRFTYIGTKTRIIENVSLLNNITVNVKLERDLNFNLYEVGMVDYHPLLIDRDNPSPMNKTISGDEIDKMAY